MKINIKPDTPLSALFRDNHHDELRNIVESWRPSLTGDDPGIDALQLSHFEFDFALISKARIYGNLALLINHDALIPDQTEFARYMTEHSNLQKNWSSLYRQLSRYRVIYK